MARLRPVFAAVAAATLVLSGCVPRPPSRTAGRHPRAPYEEMVGAVKTVIDPDLKIALLKMAVLQAQSPAERADLIIEAALKASGGSAFAVRNLPDSSTWLVTNRHVVDTAQTATVTFDRGDRTYPAEIIYADDRHDLAVISIPTVLPILKIGPTPNETDEVWALGYPGLGRALSFQITKGTVANACVTGKDIRFDFGYEGGRTCLIQHTAIIDHGSSGGPLLDAATGRVIGANTFGLRGNAYLSVPEKAIRELLDDTNGSAAARDKKAWMEDQLASGVAKFQAEVESRFTDPENLTATLSQTFIAENGYDNYLAWDRPYRRLIVMLVGLVEVMRIATIERIIADVKDAGGVSGGIKVNPNDELTEPDAVVRVNFRVRKGEKREREMRWRFEQGRWRLTDYWSPVIEEANEKAAVERARNETEEKEAVEHVREARVCRELREQLEKDRASKGADPKEIERRQKEINEDCGPDVKKGEAKPEEKPADATSAEPPKAEKPAEDGGGKK